MSQQLINRSPDLKQLRDEGYNIEIYGGHLIVHHIPYVNKDREIKYGKLISTLVLNGNVTRRPDTHVIYFMGEDPCNNDGSIITAIRPGGDANQKISDDITLNLTFSSKPRQGYYPDYYQKVTRYIEIIIAPALSIDPTVTAKIFKPIEDKEEDSVFNYIDTNTSRGNIDKINDKFKGQKIAIIGLGGTGAYVLDLVAKTPVAEIHLFDDDMFLQHNAFRSPGAPALAVLETQQKKVEYFASIYSNMHKCITPHPEHLTESNITSLRGFSCVFICIDKNEAKAKIIPKLQELGVTFIDAGLGVLAVDEKILGIVRCTTVTAKKSDHIVHRIGLEDAEDNIYRTNIQIADLNLLNAFLVVMKWKKLSGFYQDLKEEHNTTYTINTGQLINDDFTA